MQASDLEGAVAALALDHHLVSAEEAIRIIFAARDGGGDLAQLLAAKTTEGQRLAAIGAELDLPYVDLYTRDNTYSEDPELVALCDLRMLRSHNALPLRAADGSIAVAMANPRAERDMVTYLSQVLPQRPKYLLSTASQIQQRLVMYSNPDEQPHATDDTPAETPGRSLPTQVTDSPVIAWVDQLLARAAAEGASDLHLLFNANGSLLVRWREDGIWRPQQVPLRRREREIVGALMSKCPTIDPSDQRRPQDGTFSFPAPGGRLIDVRLAMLPQAYGPTIVCRLLDPDNINRRLEDMGFSTHTLEQMRRTASAPQGAVFFIGPTGSGKTTTLYGLLKEQDSIAKNILTVEDPVEYRIPNVGQTQIRGDLGEKSLTFSKALRAILRLAPDVILVGEVRDSETAETAMHAALTGHMVLSTLHAKSAVGTYERLAELGVEPYLAAESLSLAVNQRLVRRVHDCATRDAPTTGEASFLRQHNLPLPDVVAHARPDGCAGCKGTGYRGRMAVVEVMEPSRELKNLVAGGAPKGDILQASTRDGYTSLLNDAFRHVESGRTTVAELLRCIDLGGV